VDGPRAPKTRSRRSLRRTAACPRATAFLPFNQPRSLSVRVRSPEEVEVEVEAEEEVKSDTRKAERTSSALRGEMCADAGALGTAESSDSARRAELRRFSAERSSFDIEHTDTGADADADGDAVAERCWVECGARRERSQCSEAVRERSCSEARARVNTEKSLADAVGE
jgi:hypothetical protein